jgi:hypothetical protein
MITCELQDLETIMLFAGIRVLEGNDYDKAQDYLDKYCTCKTYMYLLNGEAK